MSGLFELGVVVATPAALDVLEAAGLAPAELLARHVAGDWGDVPPEDASAYPEQVSGYELQ